MKPRILFLITEDWYFWSHRLPIARAAREAGFEVLVVTRVHKHKEDIEKEGFKLIPIHLVRRSKNIIKEFLSFMQIIKIFRQERPDIVHNIAIKPVVYGSWAARIVGVPNVVNALPGLTGIFHTQKWKSSIINRLVNLGYRSAFLSSNAFGIFQNLDNLKIFLDSGIVKSENAVLIRGSGVDTSRFISSSEPDGVPKITLVSRMLWNKGVAELIEAAKQLRKNGVKCRFVLVGKPDPENPVSIPEKLLHCWHSEGIIEWWGHRDDIPEVFAKSNIVVLPSFGEGLPKVLLEAASCGRPIVATDVTGCREIVRHNKNGLLVAPRDSSALARALKILIENPEMRKRMGRIGREIVAAEFSDEVIVKQTINLYRKLLDRQSD